MCIRDSIYDDDEIFRVSANPLDPHSGAVKLLWEKNHNPDIYKETYKMLNPANFITMKLTGKFVTDYSNASLTGIVFDIVKRKWRTDMLERLEMDPDKLARLAPCLLYTSADHGFPGLSSAYLQVSEYGRRTGIQ